MIQCHRFGDVSISSRKIKVRLCDLSELGRILRQRISPNFGREYTKGLFI